MENFFGNILGIEKLRDERAELNLHTEKNLLT